MPEHGVVAAKLPETVSGAPKDFFDARHRTLIQPPRKWLSINFSELWAYRDLLSILSWRDVSIMYKQSVVGIGWAVIQPVMAMVVFSVVFGRFAKLPSDGIPYPIFTYCALIPWNYFSRSLSGSSNSLVGSSHLITKVYFPRLIIPLSKILSGLVDLGIAFVILLMMMVGYGIAPTARIFLLPFFLLIAMLLSLGVGLWLTALNVKYRDVQFVVPFLTQIWMYASPVAYSSSLVPEKWRHMYGLNPMAGVVDGFRWALLGKVKLDMEMMSVSLIIVIFTLIGGLYYFRKMEQTFADII